MIRPIPHRTIWSFVMALSLMTGCQDKQANTPPEPLPVPNAPSAEPMNCLVLVLDAFHAAKSSLYGFPEPTTPHLEQWAKRGVVFEDASSQYTSTSTSSWSYLNGRYPYHSKGISPMRDEDVPIAELFDRAGFRTTGYSDNPHISEKYGKNKGFDSFHYYAFRDDPGIPETIKKRNEVSQQLFDEVSDWIQNGDATPWFAYVHTLRPHGPYPAQEPHLSRFVDIAEVTPGEEPQEYFHAFERAFLRDHYLQGLPSGPYKRLDIIHQLYLGNIAQIDSMMGELLSELEEAGHLDNTLVVIMSDHGEAFGQHGVFGHSRVSPYREVTHVPLVIIPPRSTPISSDRVLTPVELVDVLPTLTQFFNLEDKTPRDGHSLLPFLGGKDSYEKTTVFTQSQYQLSVRQDNYKILYKINDLVVDLPKGKHSVQFPTELYSLDDDPGEQHNLSPSAHVETKLRLMGQQYMNAQEKNETMVAPELTEEERDIMESLGYLE